MFEKDAEEYARNEMPELITEDDVAIFEEKLKDFKQGAEFGYNKANEWHYVKNGDLPKDDKQYLVLFYYHYKGKKEMVYGIRDNLHSDFEIKRCYTEQIIAWKEIVPPKEIE